MKKRDPWRKGEYDVKGGMEGRKKGAIKREKKIGEKKRENIMRNSDKEGRDRWRGKTMEGRERRRKGRDGGKGGMEITIETRDNNNKDT